MVEVRLEKDGVGVSIPQDEYAVVYETLCEFLMAAKKLFDECKDSSLVEGASTPEEVAGRLMLMQAHHMSDALENDPGMVMRILAARHAPPASNDDEEEEYIPQSGRSNDPMYF